VFSAHYKAVCTSSTSNQVVDLIEYHFKEKGRTYHCQARDRQAMLYEFQPWLRKIMTYRSCLACLQRIPEHKLSCGHMFCEKCCVSLGKSITRDPHSYELTQCPLCSNSCYTKVRVRPNTAGVRVLSIDGGGIRAVIPIQFLRALEQAIGLKMPVQEHFDLSFGTSSGKSEGVRYACIY
jgi:hypothetical protein